MTRALRYRSHLGAIFFAVGVLLVGEMVVAPIPVANAQSTTPAPAAAQTASASPSVSSPSFDELLTKGLLRANIDKGYDDGSRPCIDFGQCQITDMIQIGINVMTFILGISGSVFLLMFVWGGFTWLTSAGSPNKISSGLDTLRDAVVGLIVIFSAYTLVNSVLSLVRYGSLPTSDLNTTLRGITPVQTIEIKSQ